MHRSYLCIMCCSPLVPWLLVLLCIESSMNWPYEIFHSFSVFVLLWLASCWFPGVPTLRIVTPLRPTRASQMIWMISALFLPLRGTPLKEANGQKPKIVMNVCCQSRQCLLRGVIISCPSGLDFFLLLLPAVFSVPSSFNSCMQQMLGVCISSPVYAIFFFLFSSWGFPLVVDVYL